jgi:type IV secretion system T-DNA border endonuclease VirD2
MSDQLEQDEQVWRLPNKSRGEDVRLGGGSRSSSLSPSAKARLARIARGAPEVMVKITGRARGVVHLKQHLDYITRNGRLQAELQDGSKVDTRADLRALHDDWLAANILGERGGHRPGTAQSVGIILSMPEGTPPDRVHDAARSWARATLHNHDWLLVRHDDRGHPHVHITVRAVGPTGKRLTAGPADLQRWRETFARELRRLGIDAEATPRKARGVVIKSAKSAVHRVEQRGLESRAARRRRDEIATSSGSNRSEWEIGIQARQEVIRTAYLARAEELERGTGDEFRLARGIRDFVANMPVPLTRQQVLASDRELARDRAASSQPPGPAPHNVKQQQPSSPSVPLPHFSPSRTVR